VFIQIMLQICYIHIESTSFVILQFTCERRDVITFDAMESGIKDV